MGARGRRRVKCQDLTEIQNQQGGSRRIANGPLNERQVREYEQNGFVLAENFFDAGEIGLLRRAAKEDRELDQHSFGRADGEGGTVRLSLWNHPGDTLYGMVARCESLVNSAEKLLGGEVYH